MTTSETAPASESSFTELHVVSDLHLGGSLPDHQIFNAGARLAALIDKLRLRVTESLALVLNGDIVDFLAEDGATVFDPAGAIGKLWRIIGDPAFAEVWRALRAFVATDATKSTSRRTLVFVLGNHDIELALPHVRNWLTSWLCKDDEAARGRLVWATEGAGFTALVGGRRVLCVHGNEVDDWNLVDHLALLQSARAYNRGMPAPAWSPNAGSRLVVDVMNPIKREFPFVDLLKPEVSAAVPLLLGLRPSLLGKLGSATALVGRKLLDGARANIGFLGEEPSPHNEAELEIARVRELVLGLNAAPDQPADIQKRMDDIQARIESGNGSTALAATDAGGYLGVGDWLGSLSSIEVLRAALARALKVDTTFDVGASDDTFRQLDSQVTSHVHYLIAGHTHLRRALPRQGDGCFYYNTGTWIRLITVDPRTLSEKGMFEAFFAQLKASSLRTLDDAKTAQGEPLVHVEPTVASIVADPNGTYGVLQDVGDEGELKPLQGTRFPPKVTNG